MGGLKWLGPSLFRCSTNMGQELYCSCTPEELNVDLNPVFFQDTSPDPLHPNPLLQQQGLVSRAMRVARVGAVVPTHERSLGPGNEPLDFFPAQCACRRITNRRSQGALSGHAPSGLSFLAPARLKGLSQPTITPGSG